MPIITDDRFGDPLAERGYAMKMQDDNSPLYLFRFDGQGRHSGKIVLQDMDECSAVIERAIREKETVTITDVLDVCVFRCERGDIVWPRLDQIYPKKDLDGHWLDLSGFIS